MKKYLLSAILSAIALIAFNASAVPLTVKGPITFSWTIYQSTGSTNHSTTNHTATTTNIVTTAKQTSKQFPFNDASLLKLLANSFNTNLPSGAKLATDGNTIFVVDKTGSNVVLDISTVVSVQISNNINTTVGSSTQKITSKSHTFTGSSGGSSTSYIILKYDDSNMVTMDGTHSTFEFDGISKGQQSGSSTGSINGNIFTENGTERRSYLLTGAGAGTIQNVPSVISGTVNGSAAGPISIGN